MSAVRLSGGRIPAVDEPVGAGDVAGGIGSQEYNNAGNFFRSADPAERKGRTQHREAGVALQSARLNSLEQHRRLDIPGTNAIDPNTLPPMVEGHCSRK